MRYFRYSNGYFLTVGLAICIFSVSIMFIKSLPLKLGLGICILILVAGVLSKLFERFVITEKTLVERKLFSEQVYFQWDEIIKITKVHDKKETYLIKSEEHYFFISPSIQDHMEMLDLIVDKCQHNEGLKIDI